MMAGSEPARPGCLEGVRVLDLTRVLAGPTATQLLGDLGADVIKVEHPVGGDDTRGWGPPFVLDRDGRETRESAYFLCANRNKRSVAIDIATTEGQAIVRDLAARSDVVAENFKVGGLAKYGLGYADLAKVNPRLVYCSVTGFGQTGPYKDRAGYDFIAQGLGGIMSITGEPDGRPMKVGVGIADVMCGMYAAVAILAALRHRDVTGRGQHIDMSLLDSQVAWLINAGTYYLLSGEPPPRLGNAHPNIVPYNVYQAADGHVILAVGNDRQFRAWCGHVGRAELATDPRFATNADRQRNRLDLEPIVEEIMRGGTKSEWVTALAAIGVPCDAVNAIPEVFADPQIRHRGMRIELPHAKSDSGSVSLIGNPIKLSDAPVSYRAAPPTLGEHTDAVLAETLGLSAARIESLRRAGVIR